jgi:hypothetical protein
VEAVEEVEFLAPFKFYRDQPRVVTVEAIFRPDRDRVIADCRLIGTRTLPAESEPQRTTHFTGRVAMTKAPLSVCPRGVAPGSNGSGVEAPSIYRLYFHGPAYQVLEHAWWDGDRLVGRMAGSLPPNHLPSERPTAISPRLLELCFQTAGLWEMTVLHRMGLPQHFDSVRVWGAPASGEAGLFCIVTAPRDGGSFDAQVMDSTGNTYVELSGYRTVPIAGEIDPALLHSLAAATA